MSAFVITIFVLHILSVGFSLSHLSKDQYPRIGTNKKSDDWMTLVISAAFAIWAGVLIF